MIAALAEDLFQYEVECYAHERPWREGHPQALVGLDHLQYAVEVLFKLRERGIVPTHSKLRRLQRERLRSGLNDLTELIAGFTTEDYRQVDRPRPALGDHGQVAYLRPLLPKEDHDLILFRM